MTVDKTDRRLGWAIALFALIGLGVAGYLAYVHYADKHIICLTGGGCEVVQSSRYAKFAGVPVPVLGIVGYLSILVSLLIPGEPGRAAGALFGVSGFGFSVYLTWLELARIKAICQWCVVSAVMMTLIAICTVIRLWRYEAPTAALDGVETAGGGDMASGDDETIDAAEPSGATPDGAGEPA